MADVTIEAAAYTSFYLRHVRIGPVWTDEDTAYVFYINAAVELEYRKTVNGGVDWAEPVTVSADTVTLISIWFDKWTPGDSGTKVHIAYIEETNDDVHYRSLDTSTDTLGAEKTIFDGASVVASTWLYECMDITKSRGGNLYCGFWIDQDGERGFYRSEDNGDNWAARADVTDGNVPDHILLLPGAEADDQDIWCIYWDVSANEISLKVYDDSENSWGETSISLNMAESAFYLQLSAAQRASDNHVILAAWSEFNAATADLKVWDIGGAASIVAKADVLTDSDDSMQCAVFIDQQTDDIYVAYLKGAEVWATVGAYYKKSDDGGGSWGGEVQLNDDADDDHPAIYAGHSVGDDGGYFMPVWFDYDDKDLFTSTANAVAIAAAGGVSATVTAVTATAVAAAPLPTIATIRNVTITAVTATATAAAPLPTISTALDATITAVTATATAAAPLPTITAVKNVTVSAVTATAAAAAPLPTITTGVTVTAITATATAAASVPTITAIRNVTISAVTATATAAAPLPSVGIHKIIVAVTATATAAAPLPTIATIRNVTVSAVTATATAAAPLPTIGLATFAQFGEIIASINPNDYPTGTTLKLLVVIWTSDGAKPVYARLYNVTDSVVEGESVVNTDSESAAEVLSSALSLPSGDKTYRIEVGGIAGGTFYCAKAVVRGTV